MVIKPRASPHEQTFIILHERNSNAEDIVSDLLVRPFDRYRNANNNRRFAAQSTETLRTAFPQAKFVFPRAPMLRASMLTGSSINQWFDIHWQSTEAREDSSRNSLNNELQIPGLRDAVAYLHDLINEEIRVLNGRAGSVFIGGFGQGCAASLISMLLWEGDTLGGWFGLSGWLPFAEEIANAAQQGDEDGDEPGTPIEKSIAYLRKKLGISASPQPDSREGQSLLNTPLFIAHGADDRNVPIALGRQMVSSLESLGWGHHDVQWEEYRGLAHKFSENELINLVDFLEERLA